MTREQQAALCRALGVGPTGYGWHSGNASSPFTCATCGEIDPIRGHARAWGKCSKKPIYPDILTPAGAWALWDAMEKAGWFLHLDSRTQPPRYAVTVMQYDNQHHTWKPQSGRGQSSDRAEAIARACAAALDVNLD